MSRRNSNISQVRCAGWKKSLEFVRHRGKTLQLTLKAWVTASMANLGSAALVLGLPLSSRQGCAGERDSRFRDDDIPGQVEMKDTYE